MDRDGHTRKWLRTPIKSGQVGHQLSTRNSCSVAANQRHTDDLYHSSAPKSLAKSLPARVHLTAVLQLEDDIATPTKSSALIDLASLRKTSSEHAPEEDASVGEKVLYATRVRVRSGHALNCLTRIPQWPN